MKTVSITKYARRPGGQTADIREKIPAADSLCMWNLNTKQIAKPFCVCQAISRTRRVDNTECETMFIYFIEIIFHAVGEIHQYPTSRVAVPRDLFFSFFFFFRQIDLKLSTAWLDKDYVGAGGWQIEVLFQIVYNFFFFDFTLIHPLHGRPYTYTRALIIRVLCTCSIIIYFRSKNTITLL